MILFFSGTGNSRYAARRMAGRLGEEVISITEKIKTGDTSPIAVNGRAVIVTPTYAWRIPHIVEKWLRRTELKDATDVWFVMTCGSEIGNAEKYNKQLCADRGWNDKGTAQVVMPENYLAMFDVPDKETSAEIIAKADGVLDSLADRIAAGEKVQSPKNAMGPLLSGIVNRCFYRFGVKSDAFYAKDDCISCSTCVARCPLHNIHLQGGKPAWGKNCTHCMACICNCPVEAIEYGKKSAGKRRYRLE